MTSTMREKYRRKYNYSLQEGNEFYLMITDTKVITIPCTEIFLLAAFREL